MDQRFPCPICGEALEVRQSKKHKPYVVCDPCGVQMFVRGADGITRFNEQIKRHVSGGSFDQLAEMQKRYLKKCPRCGKRFWITPELLNTSWFDGKFVGYDCPNERCDGVVKEG